MDHDADRVAQDKPPAVVLAQLAAGSLGGDDRCIALSKILAGVVLPPAQQHRAYLALRQLLPHATQNALTDGVVYDPHDGTIFSLSPTTPHILAAALRPLIQDPDLTARAVRTMTWWTQAEAGGSEEVTFTLNWLESDWDKIPNLYCHIKSRCRKMDFTLPWSDANHVECERVARNLRRKISISSCSIDWLAKEYGVESAGHAMYILVREYRSREKS